jgi:hypothetical protein
VSKMPGTDNGVVSGIPSRDSCCAEDVTVKMNVTRVVRNLILVMENFMTAIKAEEETGGSRIMHSQGLQSL